MRVWVKDLGPGREPIIFPISSSGRTRFQEVISQLVVPAKTRLAGREPVRDPGLPRNLEFFEMIPLSWIPDLTSLRSVRPE